MKVYISNILVPLSLSMVLVSCGNKQQSRNELNPSVLSLCNKNLSEAIIYDHFTPPVASRNYMYPNVAAYQALVPFYAEYRSLGGQLNGLKETPTPEQGKSYCHDLCAMAAFTRVAKKVVYSEKIIDSFRNAQFVLYKKSLPAEDFARSVAFGDSVASVILKWASTDTFRESRNFPHYNPHGKPGTWEPTGPDFAKGVEPHWRRIRTAAISSAHFYQIPRPPAFDVKPNSEFMKMVKTVYDTSMALDTAQKNIARYWDDNPNVAVHYGHLTVNELKLSPGGHWVNLTIDALKRKKAGLMESAEAFARVTIGMFDAFIACWDEKYRSHYIRPETAIRKFIDPNWKPYIQTPPFPEYPSGHSTVSGAASSIMEALHGKYEFTDSSEYEFGFGIKTFPDFKTAGRQAMNSRLYGGIHFIPANRNGFLLGEKIAEYQLEHVITRKK